MNNKLNYFFCLCMLIIVGSCQNIERISSPYNVELSGDPDISIKRICPNSSEQGNLKISYVNGKIASFESRATLLKGAMSSLLPEKVYWRGENHLPAGRYTVTMLSPPLSPVELVSKIIGVYRMAFNVEVTVYNSDMYGWVLKATDTLPKANSITEDMEEFAKTFGLCQVQKTREGYIYDSCQIQRFCDSLEKDFHLPVDCADSSDKHFYHFELKNEEFDIEHLPEALRRIGFSVKEKRLLRKTIHWKRNSPESESPADIHIDSSHHLISQGKNEAALAQAELAIKTDPNKALGYSNKSAILTELKSYFKALNEAEKAIELDETLPYAHLNRGMALYHLGRYNDALREFDWVISNPYSKKDISNLATVFRDMCVTEKTTYDNLQAKKEIAKELAAAGEIVHYVIRRPISLSDPDWQFGIVFYVPNFTPRQYMDLDPEPYYKLMGATDYSTKMTDDGYRLSFKRLTGVGEADIHMDHRIDYENNAVEIETTTNLIGIVTTITTKYVLETHPKGVLLKCELHTPSITSLSHFTKLFQDEYKAFSSWIKNIDPNSAKAYLNTVTSMQ